MYHAILNSVFAGKAAEAFCWMLIHSLWQGLLFTIITGCVMMFTKRSSAVLRYNIMSALFFLFVAVCTSTFIWELNDNTNQAAVQQNAVSGIITGNSLHQLIKNFTDYFSANASLIVMIWALVFLAKCVKMAASIVYTQRVKSHKTHQPAEYWKNKIASLCTQLQIKQTVQLLESEIIKIPVVIGHLKPIIFIPVGLLTNLPAGEVEAVLLHELAHIRRNDYFVNIIQVIAENIFFFNPALLWMSSLLREERENCCDDVAVAQTKSKKQFIQALISFKEHALYTTNYTTAFPAKKNQLLQRVTRIIHNRNKTLNSGEKIFFVTSFLVLALLSLAVTGSNNTVVKKPATTVKSPQMVSAPILPVTKVTVDNIKRYVIADKKPSKQDDKISNYNIDVANNTKHKPYVFEYKKMVIDDNRPAAAVLAKEDMKQPVATTPTDQQQAELDRQQAVKDQQQAELDRIQAERDRVQADRDRDQAIKDQHQAELDRQMAEKDKLNNTDKKTSP